MMKYTVTAVIPTVTYGNIQPSIEVVADSFEEAQAKVMPHIEALWAQYSSTPLPKQSGKLIKAFCGGEIYYDDLTHVYTNEKGEVYESGSQYANKFRKPFDKEKIAGVMASKIKGSAQDIMDMWELKSQVSRDFGNAIHKALQLYEQYGELAGELNKTTHSHDHPVIKNAVDGFIEAHKGEKVISEALIVDHEAKRAGQVDRLKILGDKLCRIQDFKTNADIDKDLEVYWHQLKFYAMIMEANGWTVEGYDIHHFNGSWKSYSKQRDAK